MRRACIGDRHHHVSYMKFTTGVFEIIRANHTKTIIAEYLGKILDNNIPDFVCNTRIRMFFQSSRILKSYIESYEILTLK